MALGIAAIVLFGSATRADQPPSACFIPDPPHEAFVYQGTKLSLWRALRDRACLVADNCAWAFPQFAAGPYSQCRTLRPADHDEGGPITLIHHCSAEGEFGERLWLIASGMTELSPGARCQQAASATLQDGSSVYIAPAEINETCILFFIRGSDFAQGIVVVPTPCRVASPLRYPIDALFSGRTYWLGAAARDGTTGVALSIHKDEGRLKVNKMNPFAWGVGLDLEQIRSWLGAVARASNAAAPLPPEDPLPVSNGSALSRALSLMYVGIIRLDAAPFSTNWYSASMIAARRWLTKAALQQGFEGVLLRPELLRNRTTR